MIIAGWKISLWNLWRRFHLRKWSFTLFEVGYNHWWEDEIVVDITILNFNFRFTRVEE
jgi:hypothetical protein